ncbi:MAG: hypothetical protein HY600_07130 [Candidatus Omnitrophica bacterium]|nr:hypothetical protein [Candidatus Omnitrophota bacterium]
MTRWMSTMAFGMLVAAAGLDVAEAQYRPAPSQDEAAPPAPEEGRFERAVELTRFRKGNYAWDTQELIQSGLTALHEEHEQLARDLASLRAEVAQLTATVRQSAERGRP